MSTRIVTDSRYDLPQEVVQEYAITVDPLYTNFGDQSNLDGVRFLARSFTSGYLAGTPLPGSARPGVVGFACINAKRPLIEK